MFYIVPIDINRKKSKTVSKVFVVILKSRGSTSAVFLLYPSIQNVRITSVNEKVHVLR